jgi:hypothetical protein
VPPSKVSPLQTTFQDLRQGEIDGWRPSLVFSPMLVEDGRRLLISNLDLRYVVSNDGNLLTDPRSDRGGCFCDMPGNYSHEALELFRLFPKTKGTFRLGTAARMSASFPFFSPAVPLPTRPRRRVVDAGYYDNYGVSLLASWLFSRKHDQWIKSHCSKVVLIQIRDGLEEGARQLAKVGPDPSSQLSRAVEELTSPLEGLYEARAGSSAFRNDGQVELLSLFTEAKSFGGRKSATDNPGPQMARFFTTVVFEYSGQASLSWYLPPDEVWDISECAEGKAKGGAPDPGPIQERIGHLLEWWQHPPTSAR